MKKTIMIVIIIINFILQTSLYHFVDFSLIVPNISLVLLVIFSLFSDNITGAILGIITGILYDVMVMDVFGIYTLLFFLTGSIVGLINEDVNKENYFTFFSITFIVATVWNLLMYIILFFLGLESSKVILISQKLILEVILDAIIAMPLSKIILIIFNKFKIKVITR